MGVSTLFDSLLDILFPPRCLVCSSLGKDIFCGKCSAQVNFISRGCEKCGRPFEGSFKSSLCSDCRALEPPFDIARSAAIYDGPLKKAICKFKFGGKTSLSTPLSKLFANHLSAGHLDKVLDGIEIVTMVPLHSKRQKERGFNQAEVLARTAANYLKIEPAKHVLLRTRNTRPQFDLRREERFVNVAGAFEVAPVIDVRNKTILLIDDILTTGATVCECSKALKGAGAKKVIVLTLSRAIDD